ncbi:MAG: polysaccharide deacetylase family protein [Candidatus Bipolaricaulia bacterium]
MRIVKVTVILIGIWMLLFSNPSSLPGGTVCSWTWARPKPGEAWYGPTVLTTDQAITVFDQLWPRWKECRLVAAVSLHFGDYEKVFTEAFPILQSYRTPATTWIVTGRIGQLGYMTLEQIRELAKNNWEIGSHTISHAPLINLGLDQVRSELEGSKAALESAGFAVSGFLSPFGLYNDLVLSEIQRWYKHHRSNTFGINPLPPSDQGVGSRWQLLYYQVKRDTPPLEVIIEIDRVNRLGGWLILDFHDIGDDDPSVSYPPEALEEIVQFMRVALKLCTLEELQRGACLARL